MSVYVLQRAIVQNIIVYLPPDLLRLRVEWRREGLAQKDIWSSLGVPQGTDRKIQTRQNQYSFS